MCFTFKINTLHIKKMIHFNSHKNDGILYQVKLL